MAGSAAELQPGQINPTPLMPTDNFFLVTTKYSIVMENYYSRCAYEQRSKRVELLQNNSTVLIGGG